METATSSVPRRGTLHAFKIALTALEFLILLLLLLPVALLLVRPGGVPGIEVDARVIPPYRAEVDGLELEFDERGGVSKSGDASVVEQAWISSLRASVDVGDSEGAASATWIIGLGAAAAAVLGILDLLKRVVSSALVGQPFAVENVRRLRLSGGLALTIPITDLAVDLGLRRWVEVGSRITLEPDFVPWWPFVVLGLGLLGLAEIFRAGSELREFEQLAI